MLTTLSSLSEAQIEAIRQLEQEMGKTILSFSGYELPPDELTPEELARIRELERQTGTMLVAVREGE